MKKKPDKALIFALTSAAVVMFGFICLFAYWIASLFVTFPSQRQNMYDYFKGDEPYTEIYGKVESSYFDGVEYLGEEIGKTNLLNYIQNEMS